MGLETTTKPVVNMRDGAPELPALPGFAIAWARDCPERVGEVASFVAPGGVAVIGRGGARDDDPGPRLLFGPERQPRQGTPLAGRSVSRTALHVFARGDDLAIHWAGGTPCRVNGRVIKKARLEAGDRIRIGDDLLLTYVRTAPRSDHFDYPPFPFNQADDAGLVGESVTAWALRRELAFCARRHEHVLVHGPPGTGKSTVARALHHLSDRRQGPLAVRSSSTIPPAWTTLELFGCAAGFPTPDAEARLGLMEAADGGTLVLDDLDNASDVLQAQLLGLLDRSEFHRPGEATARRANVRIVATTSRPDELNRDLRSRFMLDLQMPPFSMWRDDIPLLARHLIKEHRRESKDEEAQFFHDGEPRVHLELIERLLDHAFSEGVRELSRLLLQAMASSRGAEIELTPSVAARLKSEPSDLPGKEAVQVALERNQGNVSRTWSDLGLSSRHVLNRLIRRYGLNPRRASDE